jgi:hypothetical protein
MTARPTRLSTAKSNEPFAYGQFLSNDSIVSERKLRLRRLYQTAAIKCKRGEVAVRSFEVFWGMWYNIARQKHQAVQQPKEDKHGSQDCC